MTDHQTLRALHLEVIEDSSIGGISWFAVRTEIICDERQVLLTHLSAYEIGDSAGFVPRQHVLG